MLVSEADFQQATWAMLTQLQNFDQALIARMSEVLRLCSVRDNGSEHVKSGILDRYAK